jgi:hypothetical protein
MNFTDAKSEIIDLSIFKDEISKLSFNLFREWTKSVKPYHNFDLTILNEQELVAQVKEAIGLATAELFEHKKYKQEKKRKNISLQDWSVYFIMERVESQLLCYWHFYYVAPHTDMYKQWAAIRSVLSFLREDKLMEIKIDQEYEETLKNDQNLANLDVQTHKIIKIDVKSNTTQVSEEKGKVITLLENIAFGYSSKIPYQYFKIVSISIEQYFEVDLIKRIIRHNEEKLGLEVLDK